MISHYFFVNQKFEIKWQNILAKPRVLLTVKKLKIAVSRFHHMQDKYNSRWKPPVKLDPLLKFCHRIMIGTEGPLRGATGANFFARTCRSVIFLASRSQPVVYKTIWQNAMLGKETSISSIRYLWFAFKL